MSELSPPADVDGPDDVAGVLRIANCSASTSRRKASGSASRNEGSTPSGICTPSIMAGGFCVLLGCGVSVVNKDRFSVKACVGPVGWVSCLGSAVVVVLLGDTRNQTTEKMVKDTPSLVIMLVAPGLTSRANSET